MENDQKHAGASPLGHEPDGQHALVCIVDDDEAVRESLPDLVRALGYAAEAFGSAEEFLASSTAGRSSCVILDIAMPVISGPDLWRVLAHRQLAVPVIFITAQTDRDVRRRLLDQGAIECLFKPFTDTALRDALEAAIPCTRRNEGRRG